MTFSDHELQIRPSEEILLAGDPLRRPPAIAPDVIAKLAMFSKRQKLLRTEFFREHADALMNVGYALEYEPAPPLEGPSSPRDFLRVTSWNIQRGHAIDGIKAFLQEHAILRYADIILLNEVDLGMARSGNRHVAAEIVQNVMKKLIRGGFPHAMYHYLHPEELYERPVFAELENAGFTYHDLNAPETGTTRHEVGDVESESTVLDKLPPIAVKILRHKLAPWGGVAPLKVDGFTGRGIAAAAAPRSDANDEQKSDPPLGAENKQDMEIEADGRSAQDLRKSILPTVIPRSEALGQRLSDHDPIVLDLRFTKDRAPSPGTPQRSVYFLDEP